MKNLLFYTYVINISKSTAPFNRRQVDRNIEHSQAKIRVKQEAVEGDGMVNV